MRSCLILLALLATPVAAQVTTAFTYQGLLEQSGAPAQGTYDFEFELYPEPAAGVSLAGSVIVEDVTVDRGLFTAAVDFGMNVFGQFDLWLEVRVREGDATGSYTPLLPRQLITPAPLALHALNVEPGVIGSAQLANGSVTTAAIADGSVTPAAIANGSVGAAQVDAAQVQRRISGTCGAGTFLTGIGSDGGVSCETEQGDITSVNAGLGLVGGGSSGNASLAIDTDRVQSRITARCNRGTTMVAINADGSAVCEPLPISLDLTLADFGDNGDNTGIAVRTDGRPIIAYQQRVTGASYLMAYDCADAACTSGTIHTLDTTGFSGAYLDIAVRSNGLPIISYWRAGDDSALRVYDCADAGCASGTARTLFEGFTYYTSIAIRPGDLPIISFYELDATDLLVYDCADSGCSSGVARTIYGTSDTSQNAGSYSSIAIRSNGSPLITYRTGNSLVFSSCNAGCTFHDEVFPDSGGLYSAIAIRTGDKPVIVHYDDGNQMLKLIDCDFASCILRNYKDLVATEVQGLSLALDAEERPLISYYDRVDQDLKLYRCLDTDCTEGTVRTLRSGGDVGKANSIAIRPGNLPIISYSDSGNDDLRVHGCGVPDCS